MILFFVVAILDMPFAHASVDSKTKQAVEKFVRDYVASVGKSSASGDSPKEFMSYARADAEAFAACAKEACEVRFRRDVEQMEWKDPATESAPHFSAEIDVFQGGRRLADRPGCYVIEKRGEKLIMDIYISECSED